MLGIDFSKNHIKVVQLKKISKDDFVLEAGGIGEMPSSIFLSDKQEDWLKIADTLKQILARANVTTDEAIFALPESSAFITILEIPAVPEDKLEEVIKLEARKYIPFPIKDVGLDWQILGKGEGRREKEEEGRGKIKIFLVAALKKEINKYRSIADLSGLNLKFLEVQAIALNRSLVPFDYKKPILILEWGNDTTNILILEDGIPKVSRRLDFGSSLLDETIKKSLKIDIKQARKIKETIGIAEQTENGQSNIKILRPHLDKMTLSIKQLIKIFEADGNDTPEIMLVSGGGSLLNGFKNYLEKNLVGMKLHLANPWVDVKIDLKLKENLAKTAPQFSVVVGLAKK